MWQNQNPNYSDIQTWKLEYPQLAKIEIALDLPSEYLDPTLDNKTITMMCAIKTIRDAQEAVSAHPLKHPYKEELDKFTGYLLLQHYGLLQAFIIQQESANILASEVGCSAKISSNPNQNTIQKYRHAICGHPVKANVGKLFSNPTELTRGGHWPSFLSTKQIRPKDLVLSHLKEGAFSTGLVRLTELANTNYEIVSAQLDFVEQHLTPTV